MENVACTRDPVLVRPSQLATHLRFLYYIDKLSAHRLGRFEDLGEAKRKKKNSEREKVSEETGGYVERPISTKGGGLGACERRPRTRTMPGSLRFGLSYSILLTGTAMRVF